jgi:hypothetical protein
MRNAHTMILNDEVLTKLQEAYALEIISLSELAISIPSSKSAGEISRTGSDSSDPNSGAMVIGATGSGSAESNGSEDKSANEYSSFRLSTRSVQTGTVTGAMSPLNGQEATPPNSGKNTPRTPIATAVGPLINPHGSGAANTRSWHFRYTEAMPDYVIADIHRVRDELKELELRVDRDKQLIQGRIQQACNEQALAQMEFDIALKDQVSNKRVSACRNSHRWNYCSCTG